MWPGQAVGQEKNGLEMAAQAAKLIKKEKL
jgi:hypothetical protein